MCLGRQGALLTLAGAAVHAPGILVVPRHLCMLTLLHGCLWVCHMSPVLPCYLSLIVVAETLGCAQGLLAEEGVWQRGVRDNACHSRGGTGELPVRPKLKR